MPKTCSQRLKFGPLSPLKKIMAIGSVITKFFGACPDDFSKLIHARELPTSLNKFNRVVVYMHDELYTIYLKANAKVP